MAGPIRRCRVLFAVLLLTGTAAAGTFPIETVPIELAGNSADTNGLGSVTERFRIGRFEVTNPQYAAFLNAVAASDPNGLYDPLMTDSDRGGIIRTGSDGAYAYSVKLHFDDKPAVVITWISAARFCNWLHNGRPSGAAGPTTTEDGAYDMSLPLDQIARRPGARWFIPTHGEWYKAAYYDPYDPGADTGGTPNYWLYPTRSDVQPQQATADAFGDVVNPGPSVANHSGGADWNDENGNVTTVGGCGATSPWNVFDMGGNVNEMTETLGAPIPPNPPSQPGPLPTRRLRGGDFANTGVLMASPAALAGSLNMVASGANIGFRAATLAAAIGDLDNDGAVAFSDLLILIGAWGACTAPCPADLDGDGSVGFSDVLLLIANWT